MYPTKWLVLSEKTIYPAFIAKSKDLFREYNKAKGKRDAKTMCLLFHSPRGNLVNPNYCPNWLFILIKELPAQSQQQKHQKQVVTLPTVNNQDIRTTWIALLVCLYWLPWTWPHNLHLWLRAGISLLSFYWRSCLKNKGSSKFTIHMTCNE